MVQRLKLKVEWGASIGNKNTFLLEGRVGTGTDRGPLSRRKHVIIASTPAHPRQCYDLGKGDVSVMVSVVLLSGEGEIGTG